MPHRHKPSFLCHATALLLFLLGGMLTLGGGRLFIAGGCAYYVLAGVTLLLTGWLIYRRNPVALWLYCFILFCTLGWAWSEVGADPWGLMPRLDILLPVGLWLVSPWMVRRLGPANVLAFGPLAIVVLAGFGFIIVSLLYPLEGGQRPAERNAPAGEVKGIKNIRQAWLWHNAGLRIEGAPVQAGGSIYACARGGELVALDARTGRQRWLFSYAAGKGEEPAKGQLACQGVSYHEASPNARTVSGAKAPQECPRRLFLPLNNRMQIVAINADDGSVCRHFGRQGVLELSAGHTYPHPTLFEPLAAPLTTDKILVVSSVITDKSSTTGVIRGYDIYDGRLLWSFDTANANPNEILSDDHGFAPGSLTDIRLAGADEALGLVYVATGGADKNHNPYALRYAHSLLALSIATGEKIWQRALPPSARAEAGPIHLAMAGHRVLYAGTADGHILALDPRTGQDRPSLDSGRQVANALDESDMWGASLIDQLACRIMFRKLAAADAPPAQAGAYSATLRDVALDAHKGVGLISYDRIGAIKPPPAQGATAEPRRAFLSPLGLPCTQPPWNMLAALDIQTRKLLWLRAIITGSGVRAAFSVPQRAPQAGPLPLHEGVSFAAAGHQLKAYNTRTGELLWSTTLPSDPVRLLDYQADGRSFILVSGRKGYMAAYSFRTP